MELPRFPLLTNAEQHSLLLQIRQGNVRARERLINCNLRLVLNLSRRFIGRSHDLEDLFQIGCIGLMKAIDRFDLNYEVKFSTYAVPMIIGEIRRFLRDNQPVKVSRFLKEAAVKLQQCREKLLLELGREPYLKELAAVMQLSVAEVAVIWDSSQSPMSMNEVLNPDQGEPLCLLDQLADPDSQKSWEIDWILVQDLLKRLPWREQKILVWRYLEDQTQSEIARKLGLSQVQVSRLEKKALGKIRAFL